MDAAVRCDHCGTPVGSHAVMARVAGAVVPMCCEGCAAAARFIREAGLDDYYRLRTAPAPRIAAGADDDYEAWIHPDVLATHARDVAGGREIVFVVDGMHCAACAWLIDRALAREAGVVEVAANAITQRVRLRWNPAVASLPALLRRLAALGFVPHLAHGVADEARRRAARRTELLRLGLALLGTLQAMMFAEALYLDTSAQMPVATRDFLRWITLVVSTPVVFYAGWSFLAGAWRELRLRRPGMDLLIGTSLLLAYGASVVETFRGGAQVWFDAAVMFVLLTLTARHLERYARQRASARVDALARARPALAWRERADGTRERIATARLAVGDVVRVDAGEAVPADGTLLDAGGHGAWLDESLLTGESRPVARGDGEPVHAGSTCRERALRFVVTRTGTDTLLADLERQLAQAQATRPRLARVADRIAAVFVVAMLACAVAVGAVWWHVAPARAVEVTLAMLAVTCPCALSLAVPAALAAVHGRLATIGVLALRPDALATLARADVAIFDKTGTLTRGRPVQTSCEAYDGLTPDRATAIAAGLESGSGHVLAHAFASPSAVAATNARTVPGVGVEGTVDGHAWRLGRADFATGGPDDGAIWLGDGSRALARYTVADPPRDDAEATVIALRRLGLAPEICSGDGDATVRDVARRTGIDTCRARCRPDEKLAHVRALQGHGHRVLMIGDGINDAPVLAGADVSFAIGSGAAIAHRAADFVLAADALTRIPEAIALARRTDRIVRQNFAWAIGYNLCALPMAALGLVQPWLAALGMAASSLLVTLNALRLTRGAP